MAMKTYGIYMGGRKRGSVKTDDVHEYAKKVFPQGYEVKGNKLIAAEITLGEAMAIAMGRKIPGITDGGTDNVD